MTSFAWLGVLVLLWGCTKPNPKDCADGLCTDPAYPFCDIDGALAGATNTCIAVSCAPGEFEACRGDVSIVCNTVGNDYELVQCEKGCDPTVGCRACTADAECANPTPVCEDTSSACRACEADDECASMVCENGSCLAESGILYASPTGSDSSACSRAEPCSLGRVQAVALGAAVPPLVRILPGPYIVSIAITTATAGPVRFVATGATIAADKAVVAENGADVAVRGLTAVGRTNGVFCTSMGSRSKLAISESMISPGQNISVPVLVQSGCDLSLSRTEVKPSSVANAVSVTSNSTLHADRILIRGPNIGEIGAIGSGFSIGITNSVLENVELIWVPLGSGSQSYVALSFNTIVLQSGSTLNCSPGTNLTLGYYNNVITSTDVVNVAQGSSCNLSHNILFPQQSPPATNIGADPELVDPGAANYHLKPTSPAIDAASPDVLAPSVDFDGISRPQGAQADIGAYEFRP